MSTVAKIFVVINLVLAIAFCSFTLVLYAQRTDYRGRWEETKQALADTKKEFTEKVTKLEADLADLNMKLDKSEMTNKDLKGKLDEMDTSLKKSEADKEELLAQQKLLMAKIQSKDEELNRRHSAIEDLHKRITNQQKLLEAAIKHETDAVRQRIEAENQLKAVSERLATELKEKERVETELAHSKWTLDVLRDRGIPIDEIVFGRQTMPAIDGQVVAVDPDVNLVMLSVGKDDNVEKGFVFSISRGPEFVSKVRVTKVYNDMSAAIILKEYHNKNIQEGDSASTRLGGW